MKLVVIVRTKHTQFLYDEVKAETASWNLFKEKNEKSFLHTKNLFKK